MKQQARLLARIHRKYATVTETHCIGPLRLTFTRVADPDAVLERIVQEEDRRQKITGQRLDDHELHLPYWAELWDSAIGVGLALADILRPGRWSANPCVLDLGCGMGFAGMVAAAWGAQVLLADLESDALLFAQLNTLPWSQRVRLRRLNWRTDRLNESFDLILGADVLYDRMEWEHLAEFFRAHLRPGGCVLLGEPGRQSGELFARWIVKQGWKLDQMDQPIFAGRPAIRVFRLTCGRAV